jgi:hypothetical protein
MTFWGGVIVFLTAAPMMMMTIAIRTLITMELKSEPLLWLPSFKMPKCVNCIFCGAGLSLRSGFTIEILRKAPFIEAEDEADSGDKTRTGRTGERPPHLARGEPSSDRTSPIYSMKLFGDGRIILAIVLRICRQTRKDEEKVVAGAVLWGVTSLLCAGAPRIA